MPHFQIKDLGETSRKQNRVYIGECQRVTWGAICKLCPGLGEPWTHTVSYLLW